MAQKNYIKDMYENQGLSLREIARQTKHNFRTVKKYASQSDWNQAEKHPKAAGEYPVLGPHMEAVNGWLEQDKKEPRKQRHTAKRLYDRLRKERGFKGSYSTVRKYVSGKKEKEKRASEEYLPIAQPPGHAQVDFGKIKYYDGEGEAQKGYELIVTFPYSNAGWSQVFKAENQECLLEGMKRIFAHIGGTCKHARFDNMSTAVNEVRKEGERVLSDGFMRFKLHYRFGASFCNPGKGNEKGSVENKVGYLRRNMLVPVPTITDWEGFNKELLARCDEDRERGHYRRGKEIADLWEEEKEHLLALPEHEYEVYRYESLTASKGGIIQITPATYGLSPEMGGKTVQAKIYFDKIEVYHDRNLIRTFGRSYEKNEEVLDWREYLPALCRKPGAVPHTRFFGQMPKLWQKHLSEADSRSRKSSLLILMEMVADGNESLSDEALELAYDNGRTDADSIRQCYYMIARPEHHPAPLGLASEAPIAGYAPDLAAYDRLHPGLAPAGGGGGQ